MERIGAILIAAVFIVLVVILGRSFVGLCFQGGLGGVKGNGRNKGFGAVVGTIVKSYGRRFKGGLGGAKSGVKGNGRNKGFGAIVDTILKSIGRRRMRSLGEAEKIVLARLKDLRDLIKVNAKVVEIHDAVCELLEHAVTVSLLNGDEIRSLWDEVRNIKKNICRLEENGQKAENNFQTKLAQWRIQQKLQQEQLEKVQKVQKEQLAKVEEKLESLGMQMNSRRRFVQYGEWNGIFQKLVAWNLGLPWHQIASALKIEGKNWNADMHRKVNNVLKKFGVGQGKHFSMNNWELSVMLQDDRNDLCHSSIRNLQGAALESSVEKELAALRNRGSECVVEGFDGIYEGMMTDVLIVLKDNITTISQMKAAQA